MASRRLKVTYHPEKDILYLEVVPPRPAKVEENEFGVLTRYDWDDGVTIVGFEILDFARRFIPFLYHPDAFPQEALTLQFDVEEAGLKDADIRRVVEWAYQHLVAKHVAIA